jgi:MFS family permease
LLLWVHGIAGAWFRRAGSPRAAWRGFAGIVYLGCGYVFALLLATALDFFPCPEDVKTLVWLVVVPAVAWTSGLIGCGLLLQAWAGREPRTPDLPTHNLEPPSPAVGRFAVLVGTSLLLALMATIILGFRAGSLLSTWYLRASTDRAADFVGVVVYGAVYLVASLAALAAALVCGRRAIRNHDRDLLWHAGVLALIGGLQQIFLLGWPAVIGGIVAIRAADRRVAAAETGP